MGIGGHWWALVVIDSHWWSLVVIGSHFLLMGVSGFFGNNEFLKKSELI